MKEKSSNVWSFLSTLMVLAVVFVIVAIAFATMLFVLKPLGSQWINMKANMIASTMVSTEAPEPTITEPTKAPDIHPTKAPEPTEPAAEPTVEPTEAPKVTEPGELEEYSCSWLDNCTTVEVPKGAFAITFKKVGNLDTANCSWAKLSAEETIDYTVIDEFLVYSEESIPEGVTLEQFVTEASKTVWACQAHSATAITNRDTYYDEFSCSDLSKCTISTVPQGTFTVGFRPTVTNGKRDCTTIVWQEGQTIEYGKVSEFHTYDRDLPMTNLHLFIESQKPFIDSCH